MPWEVFEELNREKEAREEPLFANPRNAASGTLKLQNSAIVASRKLDAYLYYLLGEELPCDGHYENLQAAAGWGFKTSEHMKKAHSLEEVFEYIRYWDTERKELAGSNRRYCFKSQQYAPAEKPRFYRKISPMGYSI